MKVSQRPLSFATRCTFGLVACLLALVPAQVLAAEATAAKSAVKNTVKSAATKQSRGKKKLPPFGQVEQIVAGHFNKAELAGNTVISRSQVKPLFVMFYKAGWRVEEAEEIYKLIPKDDDFLVKQLRTSKGVGFGKDVAELPGAWDTLDRLAELPHGRSTVRRLVKGPDGYKMIEYITTSRGGANLATMLSKAPKGKDFKKPTGKIYTVPMLMDRLEESYAAAKAAGAEVAER